MKSNAIDDEAPAVEKGDQRRGSVGRRQADKGVLDELKRVDELNYALGGYAGPCSFNLKALKN